MQNDEVENIREEILQTIQTLIKKYTPTNDEDSLEADKEFAEFIVAFSSTLIELGYSLAANLNDKTAAALIEMATARGERIFNDTQGVIKSYYNSNSIDDATDYAEANNLGVKFFNPKTDSDETISDEMYDLKNMKPIGTA